MSEEKLIAWIKQELNARDWSIRELGRRANISHAYIAQVLKGEKSATLKFCLAIAHGFNEPVWKVFLISGIMESVPASISDDEDTKLLVKMFTELPPDTRKEALNYLRWLHSKPKGA